VNERGSAMCRRVASLFPVHSVENALKMTISHITRLNDLPNALLFGVGHSRTTVLSEGRRVEDTHSLANRSIVWGAQVTWRGASNVCLSDISYCLIYGCLPFPGTESAVASWPSGDKLLAGSSCELLRARLGPTAVRRTRRAAPGGPDNLSVSAATGHNAKEPRPVFFFKARIGPRVFRTSI